MANVNANINVSIETAQAQANLRKLQNEISAFNRSLGTANTAAASQASALNRALMDGINSTRMFDARMVPVTDSVTRFSTALEKNKLSLGEYTKYAASQLPGLRKVFTNEFQMMEKVATERVKKMQTQYVALGDAASGAQKALRITPLGLEKGYGTDLAITTQRQQLFNKLIDDGSTKLLNWGKNTQWAGRQLMVGFTLPLAALGTVAAQTFMELDKASVAFERVYGDLSTTTEEVERNKAAIIELGKEYTKFGIKTADVINLGARVAATGATNEALTAATEQTLRLATLGQMDYNTSLEATISLQTAFQVSNENLAEEIDYLNIVENQTILTMEDMAAAIPRVAPVIKGLGGDVRDLAVMMTALREGGVSAEQGANALKSGLASLINPTSTAVSKLKEVGISLDEIIATNRGDLMGVVRGFADALKPLDDFTQQQVLEQVFGKFQYARLGALFQNITNDSSQAARAMDAATMSAQELAAVSEKELGKISESTTARFQAAVENLRVAIAPLGEAFMKGVMPIAEFLTKIANAFNDLPDPVKNAFAVITGVVAGLGPVFLMTIGLIGNGLANLVKGIQFLRKTIAKVKGDAQNFDYLSMAELEAKAATESLDASVQGLTGSLVLQKGAVSALIREYQRYASVAGIAGAAAARGRGGKPQLKMATGGVVPGSGSGDKVPALLEPGETVVTKQASQKFAPILAAMNDGTIPGFQGGVVKVGSPEFFSALGMSEGKMKTQSVQRFSTRALQQELEITINELEKVRARFTELGDSANSLKKAMVEVVGKEKTPSMRKLDRPSMGAGKEFKPQTTAFEKSGMFSGEERFIRQKLGSAIDEDLFKINVSHIEKEVVDGIKQWRPENLIPDFQGVNQTLENRMRSFNAAIEKGSISISDTAKMMQNKTPELLRGMNSQQIEAELNKLRAGIHPVTENATKVATSFAKLDAALSKEALALGQERTRLGTRSATGKQSEFMAAAGEYRLGEGREEVFGQGGRSEQRYSQISQRGQRDAQAYESGVSSIITAKDDPFEKATALRRSPHPKAAAYGRQDAIAYLKSREAQLAAMPTAMAMTPTQKATTELLQSKRAYTDKIKMEKLGMTETQIARQQRRLVESRIKQEQIKLSEARKSAALAAQSTKLEQAANAAKTTQVASQTAGVGASRMGAALGAVRGKAGIIGMGLGMGSMVPFMQGNTGLGMGMMGAGMAFDMLAMTKLAGAGGILGKVAAGLAAFAGPLAIATAAITAVGVGLYLWRKNVDEAARKAAELGANLGGTANAVKTMGDLLGKSTPVQRRAQLAVGALTPQEEENAGQYSAILESETGQEFLNGLKEATSAERFTMLSDYVANGIATGLMDYDFATGFVKSVSTQLGDGMMGKQVLKEIEKYEDMSSKTQAMMDIASKRIEAAQSSAEFQAMEAGEGLSSNQASNILGQSLQIIQDFADVSALAEEEFAAGIISYDEYIAALDKATAAQNRYADAVLYSLEQSGDRGATEQALKEQLENMNYNEEAINTLIGSAGAGVQGQQALDAENLKRQQQTQVFYDNIIKNLETANENYRRSLEDPDMTSEERDEIFRQQLLAQSEFNAYLAPGIGGPAPLPENLQPLTILDEQGRKIYEEAESKSQEILAAMLQAILNGMNPEEASRISKEIVNNPNSPASKAFNQAIAAGAGEFNAMQSAIIAEREEKTPTAGITKRGSYAKAVAQMSGGEGGATVADIDAYFQGLPEDERQEFIDFALENDNKLKGELAKKWIQSSTGLQKAAGGANVSAITQSREFMSAAEKGEEEKIIGSMQGISAQLGGDQTAVQAYIDFVMTQNPPDLETRLPDIEQRLKSINDNVPPEIQKVLGLEVSSPEGLAAVEAIDPKQLKIISDIVAGMPEEKKEFGGSLAFTITDGKKSLKDPKTFLKDFQKAEGLLEKMKSSDKKVKKTAAFELLTQMKNDKGETVSQEGFDAAFQGIIEQWGEGVVMNLPPDVLSKALEVQFDVNQLRAQAAAMRASAATAGYIGGPYLMQQAAELEATADALEAESTAAVAPVAAAAASEAGTKKPEGGGGGGDKANPFKDLVNSIMNQIKGYADATAKFKSLFNEKNKFFQILQSQKGIDDKIRKAGLAGTPLGEQIAALDPKEAQKVLNRITGKGGGLNALGRKVESAAVLGSVAQRTSEAQTSIQASRAQATATRELQRRGLGTAENIEAIAGDPDIAKEYIALLNQARKAEQAWIDAGSKKRGKAWQEWKRAQKAVDEYVKSVAKAARLERATSSAINMEVETQRNLEGAAAVARVEAMPNVSQDVKDWVKENPQEFADLEFEAAQRVEAAKENLDNARTKKQKKRYKQEYEAALQYQNQLFGRIEAFIQSQETLDPGTKALEKIDKEREATLQEFDTMKAAFELEFVQLEQAFKPGIKASQKIIQGLEDQIQAVNDVIKGLQRQVEAQQRIVRGLERQKEMLQRQIAIVERQNEMDQRRADALSRQAEMVQRQIGILDRQNELDQRRAQALSRQEEMLGRQTEQINRQIQAAERQSELDQRVIDEMGRADEMRQRQAEALNRELELMGRKEEDIRKAYDERIKQLDKVEKAQDRINQKQKDQLDLAKALSTGDIYAAAAAAAQMRENQIAASRQDTRSALEQGMESQIGGLRTSGGLSREQAEGQVEVINDQSYQVQLAIRDIQDQIYERTQALIPLRDQIYNIDLQIRDIADQRLVIEDQIYAREQERIPFLDQIYNLELNIRDINDAIYDRNLSILPLKDQQYALDLQIQGVNDVIYGLENQIYDIQKNRLEPLQDALDSEQKILRSKERQLQEAKDNVRVNGITYEQLNDMIQSESAIYEYTKAQIIQNSKNAQAVAQIANKWRDVAQRINAANFAARSAANTAKEYADSMVTNFKPDPYSGLTPAQQAAEAKRNAQAWLNQRLGEIEATRQAEVNKARQEAIDFTYNYAGGRIKKYPMGGRIPYAVGGVAGDGGRDSVMAMLTPGEFVIRKPMVDKYGEALMNAINLGSFSMPRYKTAGIKEVKISDNNNKTEVNAPVYNNYSVNVNVPNANIDANDVANKVITKIKAIESKSVRSYRGF